MRFYFRFNKRTKSFEKIISKNLIFFEYFFFLCKFFFLEVQNLFYLVYKPNIFEKIRVEIFTELSNTFFEYLVLFR